MGNKALCGQVFGDHELGTRGPPPRAQIPTGFAPALRTRERPTPNKDRRSRRGGGRRSPGIGGAGGGRSGGGARPQEVPISISGLSAAAVLTRQPCSPQPARPRRPSLRSPQPHRLTLSCQHPTSQRALLRSGPAWVLLPAGSSRLEPGPAAMAHYKVEQDDWLTVYLKYLLFVFNFFFWVGGAAVMAVGVWTLVEKSGYLGVLASSTFAASAYILIFVGALVMVTGFLGFGAVIREDRGCLSAYFCLLLAIFLVELVAGVLAHVYYQRLSDELKQHLTRTLAENYRQPGAAEITASVDRLQQDFKCCGSNSSADWLQSSYILSPEAEGRRVPDSCCKTVVARCGQRAHPSNIYKVEGGCISKLEQFLADHLLLMGAVGIGVACLQICGMILTCGLHRRLQLHFY